MTGPLGPFVVPQDVMITAAEGLDVDVRGAAGAVPGDFLLMRPRARAASKIIDGGTAALLESFREPHSIADGIIAFSRQRSLDPSPRCSPRSLLSELVRDRFLVPAGAPAAHPILPSLLPGHRVDVYEVISGITAMEDTELTRSGIPTGVLGRSR